MNSKLFLLSLLFVSLFLRSSSNEDCQKWTTKLGLKYACGTGCTGTPSCGKINCGNVDNMCYCYCKSSTLSGDVDAKCKTSELGYTWNHGIKLANGSYALNGKKGDGGEYKC
jgi:hypothetical protein